MHPKVKTSGFLGEMFEDTKRAIRRRKSMK